MITNDRMLVTRSEGIYPEDERRFLSDPDKYRIDLFQKAHNNIVCKARKYYFTNRQLCLDYDDWYQSACIFTLDAIDLLVCRIKAGNAPMYRLSSFIDLVLRDKMRKMQFSAKSFVSVPGVYWQLTTVKNKSTFTKFQLNCIKPIVLVPDMNNFGKRHTFNWVELVIQDSISRFSKLQHRSLLFDAFLVSDNSKWLSKKYCLHRNHIGVIIRKHRAILRRHYPFLKDYLLQKIYKG
jgi:hypothetical protein